ncbi:CGLD27 family protein [Waterburya agarophytonicola K14]|uniref:CGLD27 family protein n=1 Tax=Waterburya agarophytonicola KI4 TaxID=2874699 RepID=A0A964BNC5_9CYAN|nr:CGLD27 family protein [Waterburya agarophytonicola]MCC0175791.1 CGLD27 family protein [Waterburya agarophytonicola KI4]
MNKSTINFCPVPIEQQPINEYEKLKESWLFDWGTLAIGQYSQKIAWVCFWSAILVIPLAMSVFVPQHDWFHGFLSSLVGICLLTGIFISRIYLGWQYIKDRLKSDRIFYEESGWYDGQTWIKPTGMLNRDRLVASYEIEPILARFHKTYGLLGMAISLSSLIWLIIG